MVENFRELDERHFCVRSSHIDYPPAECLAKGVGGEVPCFDLVAYLDELEMSVHHLARDDAAEPVPAVEDVNRLRTEEGQNFAPLLGLDLHLVNPLLCPIYLRPFQRDNVRYT